MSNKDLYTAMRFTGIVSLVLVLAFGAVEAAKKEKQERTASTSSADSTLASTVSYYEASFIVQKGKSGGVFLVREGKSKIYIAVLNTALDAYMDEQGINSVEITVSVLIEFIEQKDGDGYYLLDFIFGPSGAYFEPPLKLYLYGKYSNSDVWLYDENGERLEGQYIVSSGNSYYLIPHFSSYVYDHYNY